MDMINKLHQTEMRDIEKTPLKPCTICKTTKPYPRYAIVKHGIVCKNCYLKALDIGVKMLADGMNISLTEADNPHRFYVKIAKEHPERGDWDKGMYFAFQNGAEEQLKRVLGL